MQTDQNFKQERMTTEEAANYLGLSKKTIAGYRCDGVGPKFVKLGSRVFYKKSDLDSWVDANSGLVSTTQAKLRKGGLHNVSSKN